jgi:DNA-binding MarR family transcriptional regulator
MKDKELLSKAIKEFDKFTKSQKALLVIITEFADGDTANVAISSIAKMSGYSKTIIYKSLIKLEQLNFISREKVPQEKVGYIKLNPSAFQQVLDFYTKKQQFLPKKVY